MGITFTRHAAIKCDGQHCNQRFEIPVENRKGAYATAKKYGWAIKRRYGRVVSVLCDGCHFKQIAPTLPPLERIQGETSRFETFTWQTGCFSKSDYPTRPAPDAPLEVWQKYQSDLSDMYSNYRGYSDDD